LSKIDIIFIINYDFVVMFLLIFIYLLID